MTLIHLTEYLWSEVGLTSRGGEPTCTPISRKAESASSMARAVAASPIENPDAAYLAATTKIDIDQFADGTTLDSISDGTLTVSFSDTVAKTLRSRYLGNMVFSALLRGSHSVRSQYPRQYFNPGSVPPGIHLRVRA